MNEDSRGGTATGDFSPRETSESAGTGPAAGMAHSTEPRSRPAGREVAERACDGLASGDAPGWAIAFCGGQHDGAEFLAGMRDILGGIPIVGGAAAGIISHDLVGYQGIESGAALIPGSLGAPVFLTESTDETNDGTAGERLGERIRDVAEDGDSVLLFFDSLRSSPPPLLHAGSHLVEGIYRGLGLTRVHLVGGGTLGDMALTGSFLFDGERVCKHAATAVVLPRRLSVQTTSLHACLPASSFLDITRKEGAVVHEIDGQPAVKALERVAGGPVDAARAKKLELNVQLGQHHGDMLAPFDAAAYVNRLIVSIDPESGSFVLFEPDFREGSRVQVMVRDNDLMFESIRRRMGALMADLEGRDCLLGLYIDCAGRAKAMCGTETEEAEAVLAHCRPDIPVLGFYSGVEVAPLLGRSRPLDLTGVMTVLCVETGKS